MNASQRSLTFLLIGLSLFVNASLEYHRNLKSDIKLLSNGKHRVEEKSARISVNRNGQ